MRNRLGWLLGLMVSSLAWAHGVPPQSLAVSPSPWTPGGLVVSTTFGALVSDDRCTYEWICPEVLGFGAREQPTWTATRSGTLFAAAISGLAVSRDRGCSFERHPDFESRGAADVVEAGDTLFVTSARFGVRNGLWASTDDGKTFSATALASEALFFNAVRVAPSDPRRVVVSAWYFEPRRLSLFVSDDRAASFSEIELTAAFSTGSVFTVHAIDASNASVLFASVVDDSVTPERTRLLKSVDGGRTFVTVLTADGRVSSMAQDGGLWWLALGDRVYRSTNGSDFEVLEQPRQRACVARLGGETLACGRQSGEDGFAVARLDAPGAVPVLTWSRISGPRACPADAPTTRACSVVWPVERAELGLAPDHVATCGGPSVEPGPVPPPRGGCQGAPVGAGLVSVLLFFLGRTRRVESANR
ncbi:MAG: hypothetical protein SFW67_11880 [Myxococcaceae bacterium]|nr:hypothetical protein [Myxococcaceae bacterium]